MKKMDFIAVLLTFALFFTACTPVNQSPGQFIDEAATRFGGQVSGMSIKVFTNDEILFENSYGYANEAEGLVVDHDTVFKWGSITKSLVWISILQLAEQGKLDLHTDIRAYLPDDVLSDLKYPTTVYHLMTHSSGWVEQDLIVMVFGNEIVLDPLTAEIDTPADSIERFLRDTEISQRFQPGSYRGEYSHYGVIVASYIVEQVSGMTFYEYVHNYIFARLNMEHAAILLDASDNVWVAKALERQNCYVTADRSIEAMCRTIPLASAYMIAGVVSTMADFHRFALALLPDNYGGSALFEHNETLEKLHSILDYEISGYTDSANGIIALNGQMCHTVTMLIDTQRNIGVIVMTNQEAEVFFNRVTFLREVIERFTEGEY